MVFLLALDLAVLPKTQKLLTIEELKEMKTKEKDSSLSNSEKTSMLHDEINLVITYVISELKDHLEDLFDDHHDIALSSTSKSKLNYKGYL